jgi:2-iminobutanoate/2-iminopropanoate deaminase
MQEIQRIQLDQQLSEPLSHYVDAIICNDMLWISGLLPTDVHGNIVGGDDPAAQTEQVFKNIKAVLDHAGISFANVIKVIVYLRDVNHRTLINPVREKYFGEYRPISTLVEISKLAHPDALIEIETVAYIGKKRESDD